MYKLKHLDNEGSAGQAFVGTTATFRFDGRQFFFASLYSSTVKSIAVVDNLMIVKTRNSIYTFEKEN